mmetsp:Transcript_25003/g.54141  ORF Transcript_25003/g.54141 Transcript_25003/m.54141 type:complete len:89 (+) Transcript_25003:55-321(+)
MICSDSTTSARVEPIELTSTTSSTRTRSSSSTGWRIGTADEDDESADCIIDQVQVKWTGWLKRWKLRKAQRTRAEGRKGDRQGADHLP